MTFNNCAVIYIVLVLVLMIVASKAYIRGMKCNNFFTRPVLKRLCSNESPLADLIGLRGVGPAVLNKFGHLQIFSLSDVLFHLPIGIVDKGLIESVSDALEDEYATVKLVCERIVEGGYGGAPHKIYCRDNNNTRVVVVYFLGKQSYAQSQWSVLRNRYQPGNEVIVGGKIAHSKYEQQWSMEGSPQTVFQFTNPDVVLTPDEMSFSQDQLRVQPIYPLTQGLTLAKLKSVISSAIDVVNSDEVLHSEWIDPTRLQLKQWPEFMTALKSSHSPQSENCLSPVTSKARERLAFEEFVALHLQDLRNEQKRIESKKDTSISSSRSFATHASGLFTIKLREALPFALTTCQVQAVEEIRRDLEASDRMVRLVQGDVGTGKTVVSAMAIMHVLEAGKQCALLAPTEILAKQHLQILTNFFQAVSPGLGRALEAELITGAVKGGARDNLLARVSSGEVDVLVGTHALLGESIIQSFKDLGLVVIDEEQRFGVAQRDILADRTNVLFTTATPIPRSLVRFMQGRATISTLTTKPPAKREVRTILLESSLVDKIIERIGEHVHHGSKVFWVTPCLHPSANLPGVSATERFALLSGAFPGEVGLLHGQMSADDKDLAMKSFADSKTHVLVATSIVEVGIDIPDASICVIDRAENFGLAQIHQIRGRIGRGAAPPGEKLSECFCVLLYDDRSDTITSPSPLSPDSSNESIAIQNGEIISDSMNGQLYDSTATATEDDSGSSDYPSPHIRQPSHSLPSSYERLKILTETNDCFTIAEKDLLIRGPGDIFGFRQHGEARYRVAEMPAQTELFLEARVVAQQLWNGTYPTTTLDSLRVTRLNDLFVKRSLGNDVGGDAKDEEEVPLVSKKVNKNKQARGAYSPAMEDVHTASDLSKGRHDLRNMEEIITGDVLTALGTSLRDPSSTSSLYSDGDGDGDGDTENDDNDIIYVVFDLETTGLSPKNDRVIQLAAKVMGSPYEIFNAYILPNDKRVSEKIHLITGINQEFLEAEGRSFSEAWGDFKEWVETISLSRRGDGGVSAKSMTPATVATRSRKVVIVAHNGRNFDYNLMKAEVARLSPIDAIDGITESPVSWCEEARIHGLVDTLDLFRNKKLWSSIGLPQPPSCKLSALYDQFADDCDSFSFIAHNAVGDVMAMESILQSKSLKSVWRRFAEIKTSQ